MLFIAAQNLEERNSSTATFVRLKSITFNKKGQNAYKKKQLVGLKIDSKGKLTPTSGYKLGRTIDKKFYQVAPTKSSFTRATGGFDKLEGPTLTYYCLCEDSDGNDDCKWKPGGIPPHMSMQCQGGSCNCIVQMLFNDMSIVTAEEIY